MTGPYEAYALKHGRLHPDCVDKLQPYFDPLGFDVHSVRVKVGNRWFGYGVLVTGGTLQVLPGVLDSPVGYRIRGHDWNWTTPRGVALYAHECHHVYSWEQAPWWFAMQVGWGMLLSWFKYRQFYAHEAFRYEREAIAFEDAVQAAEEQKHG